VRDVKRAADPQKAAETAMAFAVSRLTSRQYDVYRLFSLYGPATDEELKHRVYIHGVRMRGPTVRKCRDDLVLAGLLRMTLPDPPSTQETVWSVNPSLMQNV